MGWIEIRPKKLLNQNFVRQGPPAKCKTRRFRFISLTYYPLHASETPPFFFCHLCPGTKKRDWIPLPPDHPIGHISGCGWSWRTIERSIPSHFAARFQRLFHIGAVTRAHGARSIDKGQIWGKFEANFGATPALGIIPSPHQPPAH